MFPCTWSKCCKLIQASPPSSAKKKRLKTVNYDDEESRKAQEAVAQAVLELPSESDLKLTFMEGDQFGGGGGDDPPNHGCKVSKPSNSKLESVLPIPIRSGVLLPICTCS